MANTALHQICYNCQKLKIYMGFINLTTQNFQTVCQNNFYLKINVIVIHSINQKLKKLLLLLLTIYVLIISVTKFFEDNSNQRS